MAGTLLMTWDNHVRARVPGIPGRELRPGPVYRRQGRPHPGALRAVGPLLLRLADRAGPAHRPDITDPRQRGGLARVAAEAQALRWHRPHPLARAAAPTATSRSDTRCERRAAAPITRGRTRGFRRSRLASAGAGPRRVRVSRSGRGA